MRRRAANHQTTNCQTSSKNAKKIESDASNVSQNGSIQRRASKLCSVGSLQLFSIVPNCLVQICVHSSFILILIFSLLSSLAPKILQKAYDRIQGNKSKHFPLLLFHQIEWECEEGGETKIIAEKGVNIHRQHNRMRQQI